MKKILVFFIATIIFFVLYLILGAVMNRLKETMGWKTDFCFIASTVCAIATVVFFVLLMVSIIAHFC